MARLDLDENQGKYQIRAFKPGMIQINEQILTHSLIVTNETLIENWAPQRISELTAASLSEIIKLNPDILLLGTGTHHELLPLEIYGELINHGIGVEIMDTAAACRTFNALSSEDRNVAAALIIR